MEGFRKVVPGSQFSCQQCLFEGLSSLETCTDGEDSEDISQHSNFDPIKRYLDTIYTYCSSAMSSRVRVINRE